MARPPRFLSRYEVIFANTVVILLAIMTLLPFLWFVVMSFKPADQIFAGVDGLFFKPTLENYEGLVTERFMRSMWNSIVTSTVSTVLALVIGIPGAYALSRASLKRDRSLSLLILASRMAPPVAFAIPYFLVYRNLGILDTKTGLIIVYLTFNLALVVWLMRNFFDATPRELEEAAWIDGASLWGTFIRIVLPMSGPAVVTTGMLCFLYSWNDFFFALTLTRNNAMTAPVEVVNFMNYEGWEWGKIAAGGTLIMAPVLIFSLLMRKYLVAGMTAGAVKG
ncbi:carbohydrate ABC transporter permease [Brucella thiophenivorans]|uniref:Maltose/maltodextrin transport system permease protein MalG n=1 Tax=Brucella thiophenivorans TaxID=571255 RepID=A0A256FES7_9HYPH|nr:carbohydrate ABC transporter permease [Brucella thiophenivorans]OYR13359.1 binding-protein-dependent transport system inner membrane component family protein [Brucella thiophenivorans]